MSSPTATAPALLAARNAVFVVFFANGLVFASWASRLPTLRSDLDLSPAALGFTLLFISIGSVGSLPLSGPIVHRFGPRNAVAGAAVIVLVGIALVGFAPDVPVLAVSFLLCGMGIGTWDVAMNVEGADVEQQLGRPIMSRFHAGFSLGTVAGAGLGALLTHLDVGVAVHLPAVSLAAAVTLVFALRGFQPVEPEVDRAAGSGTAAAWRDRRTLILGLLVLGMAFAEGSANDWLAVGLVDGYDVSEAAGALGFAVFVTGMTAGRLVGPVLITRWGRVATVRGSGVLVLDRRRRAHRGERDRRHVAVAGARHRSGVVAGVGARRVAGLPGRHERGRRRAGVRRRASERGGDHRLHSVPRRTAAAGAARRPLRDPPGAACGRRRGPAVRARGTRGGRAACDFR